MNHDFYLIRGYNHEDIGEYEKARQEQLKGKELCKESPRFKILIDSFDLALKKHKDREMIKTVNEIAHREANGNDFDFKKVIAQKNTVLKRFSIIILINLVIIVAVLTIYRKFYRKHENTQ